MIEWRWQIHSLQKVLQMQKVKPHQNLDLSATAQWKMAISLPHRLSHWPKVQKQDQNGLISWLSTDVHRVKKSKIVKIDFVNKDRKADWVFNRVDFWGQERSLKTWFWEPMLPSLTIIAKKGRSVWIFTWMRWMMASHCIPRQCGCWIKGFLGWFHDTGSAEEAWIVTVVMVLLLDEIRKQREGLLHMQVGWEGNIQIEAWKNLHAQLVGGRWRKNGTSIQLNEEMSLLMERGSSVRTRYLDWVFCSTTFCSPRGVFCIGSIHSSSWLLYIFLKITESTT